MTKFKVGDVIKFTKNKTDRTFTIVRIVFESEDVEANWEGRHTGKNLNESFLVKNSYITLDNSNGFNYTLWFGREEDFSLVSVSPATNNCPRCNENLEEKFSEYTNSTILKCPKCKWC